MLMAVWGTPHSQLGAGIVPHSAAKPGLVTELSVCILTVMVWLLVKGPGTESPQNFWRKSP